MGQKRKSVSKAQDRYPIEWVAVDIVNIGLHFFLKNVRPYAASCSEA